MTILSLHVFTQLPAFSSGADNMRTVEAQRATPDPDLRNGITRYEGLTTQEILVAGRTGSSSATAARR